MRARALLFALLAAALAPSLAGADSVPAPETTITSSPPDPFASTSATFDFTSDQADSTFACALDEQSFKRCTSPKTYTDVPEGLHTFFVFAVHNDRKDPTPAARTWTVDTTPPAPVKLQRPAVSYRKLTLTWALAPGTDHVVVLRSTRAKQVASTQVYKGAGTSYVESKFLNAQYHAYRIRSYDKAGNVSSAVDVKVPASALLLSPADGARIHRPPTFRWRAVPRAHYYNVQLWQNGEKILSLWPTSPKLKLAPTWTYKGRHYRLKPGRYIWFVWPGFGPPQKGIYGQPIGQSSFSVS
jgi:hypothetical protein